MIAKEHGDVARLAPGSHFFRPVMLLLMLIIDFSLHPQCSFCFVLRFFLGTGLFSRAILFPLQFGISIKLWREFFFCLFMLFVVLSLIICMTFDEQLNGICTSTGCFDGVPEMASKNCDTEEFFQLKLKLKRKLSSRVERREREMICM